MAICSFSPTRSSSSQAGFLGRKKKKVFCWDPSTWTFEAGVRIPPRYLPSGSHLYLARLAHLTLVDEPR